MKEMFTFRDDSTGYIIRQYTNSKERSHKLYFTTESFTSDDKYFYYFRVEDGIQRTWRVDAATGDQELALDESFSHLGMDYNRDYAYARKGDSVYRLDTLTGQTKEIGTLPPGVCTGHFSASKSGMVWCSYQLANKIYALVMLDPKVGVAQVMWQDDHRLGHLQACPGDDDSVMYIHETGGDALQRIWMFDVPTRRVRPYFVEKEGDWITHEVWSADGDYLYFMRYPHDFMRGTRDGHNFRVMANSRQYLHGAPDRQGKWLTADRITGVYQGWKNQVVLINAQTGAEEVMANLHEPSGSPEHPHPSFNRGGSMVLYNNPIDKGFCQVCAIDLGQVKKP